ncbi:MAG: primosomal protein N' [Chloroflexi bacterium]|nr:primosomal protein N' [Chloroflexota bacterium]
MSYAEVAVDVPGASSNTYTYAVPDGLAVEPGHAVWVPFGSRIRRGIVFALADSSEFEETRPIDRLLNPIPLISGHQIELARWVSEYYRSGLFLAASLMLPPGFADTLRTFVSVPESGRSMDGLSQRERRAMTVAENTGRLRRDQLGRRLGRGGSAVVDRLVRRGYLRAETVWERPRLSAVHRNFVTLAVSPAEAIEAADSQRSERRGDLLRLLAESPDGVARPELTGRFGQSAVQGLTRAGILQIEKRRVDRDPLSGRTFEPSIPLKPTRDQQVAIDRIVAALDRPASGAASRFLLYGVTGSGKTEVYMQAADACLRGGRSVIVLVPEIALTPQLLDRFGGRFGGRVALLHSGLSPGERFDQWWGVHRGDYRIVLGSRSAIFAPLGNVGGNFGKNVGLVVIDEEHEWTYKQHDTAPRYHSRAVAERLAELTGAVVVAGSATPDVETYRRAERGEYQLLRLPDRISSDSPASGPVIAADRSSVTVIDMREELRAGNANLFSRSLADGIGKSLDAGGRVILFLNRRGAASHVQCRSCGHVRRCSRCDTALVLHRAESGDEPATLACHYCSRRIRYTNACPICSERRLLPSGSGTQGVVDEVERLFPSAGVLRWDRDVARTARAHSAILEEFLHGGARVLVGTQMLAKGLDIPSVTLVGVVSADTGLSIPDFRAGERAFQILTQVAGRAGRGSAPGRAIIQTYQPEHYAVRAAAAQDFEAFYRTEIELRRRHANPPFTRIIKLAFGDPDAQAARDSAFELADALRHENEALGLDSAEVLGPSPSFPTRVRGVTRWHIAIKGSEPARLLEGMSIPPGWTVDVDPISVT